LQGWRSAPTTTTTRHDLTLPMAICPPAVGCWLAATMYWPLAVPAGRWPVSAGRCWTLLAAAGGWWLFLRRQTPRRARAHGRTHTTDALQQSIPLRPAHPNPTQSNPSHSNSSNPLRPGRSPACGVCLAAGSRQPKAGKRVRRRRTKLPIHHHHQPQRLSNPRPVSPHLFQSIPEAPPAPTLAFCARLPSPPLFSCAAITHTRSACA
jgi:hypothetical protein